MDQKTSDQGWEQLQSHIEGFVGQVLGNNMQRIEYKPRFIAQLLEMPLERRQERTPE
jgi:hypothetical protein